MTTPETSEVVPRVLQEAFEIVKKKGLSLGRAATVCGCHSCKAAYKDFVAWLRSAEPPEEPKVTKEPHPTEEGGENAPV